MGPDNAPQQGKWLVRNQVYHRDRFPAVYVSCVPLLRVPVVPLGLQVLPAGTQRLRRVIIVACGVHGIAATRPRSVAEEVQPALPEGETGMLRSCKPCNHSQLLMQGHVSLMETDQLTADYSRYS